jgi:DNA polymerase sigma
VTTDIYGSFASGLAIESSDIDLSVKYTEGQDIVAMMNRITESLKASGKVESVTPIYTASVPVIKLVSYTLTP